MDNTKQNTTLDTLRETLAEITGNGMAEILPESHLEDDLSLILEEDFPRLFKRIMVEYHDDGLELDGNEVREQLEDAGDTVAALARIIDEELKLG